jgi:putative transposase
MKKTKEPTKSFDYKIFEEEALNQLKSGKPLEGADGILAPLIKRLVEASLEGELVSCQHIIVG